MEKSLSEYIRAKAAAREPSQKEKNRAQFLAQADEIENAMNEGWSGKIIWEALKEQGKIEFGYKTFLRYVEREIANKHDAREKTIISGTEELKTEEKTQAQNKAVGPVRNSGPAKEAPPTEPVRKEKSAPASQPLKRKFDIRGYPFEVKDEETGETKICWAEDERGFLHSVRDEKSGGIVGVWKPYPQKEEDFPGCEKPVYEPGQWNPHPTRDWAKK